jgi:hypothetical protein
MPNAGRGPMDYGAQPDTTAMPLLAFDHHISDAGEFDYSAFLQDQQDMEDMDYLAEESSGSTAEPRLTPASSSSGPLPDPSLQLLAPRQEPLALCPSQALAAAHSRGSSCRDSSTSPGAQGHSLAQAKQRLERRGHTKSRRGCFNCKRRRIKVWRPAERVKRDVGADITGCLFPSPQCQETRPACGHCTKQGLKCEYPALPTIVHQVRPRRRPRPLDPLHSSITKKSR